MQPERRKHVRILTIKNFGRAMLVLVIALVAANIISEMRKPRPGEFGRLTLDAKPVAVKHPEVVTESEVPDETPVGPSTSLVTEPPPVSPVPQRVIAPAAVAPVPAGRIPGATQNHVTIVGGADGIRVETAHGDATPKLSGGIFRQ